jgi:hypothetical protein
MAGVFVFAGVVFTQEPNSSLFTKTIGGGLQASLSDTMSSETMTPGHGKGYSVSASLRGQYGK